MYKVYITDHTFADTDPEREVLAGIAELVDLNGKPMRSEEDVLRSCPDADALIIGFAPIRDKVLAALPDRKSVV